jgi:hypothetical protein
MLGFCFAGASLSSSSTWNVLSGFSVSLAPIIWFADAKSTTFVNEVYVCRASRVDHETAIDLQKIIRFPFR